MEGDVRLKRLSDKNERSQQTKENGEENYRTAKKRRGKADTSLKICKLCFKQWLKKSILLGDSHIITDPSKSLSGNASFVVFYNKPNSGLPTKILNFVSRDWENP